MTKANEAAQETPEAVSDEETLYGSDTEKEQGQKQEDGDGQNPEEKDSGSDGKKAEAEGEKAGDKKQETPDDDPKKEDDSKDSKESKDDDSKKGDSEKEGPPEKYDLKLPKDSQLDEGRVEEIAEFAKKRGFSNEVAQEILERESEAVGNFHQKQVEDLERRSDEWLEQVKKDPELGGENANKNVELAKRFIDRFGSEGLKDELDKTRFGNHPEVIRMFSRLGKAMGEDTFESGGKKDSNEEKSDEDVFYGNDDK